MPPGTALLPESPHSLVDASWTRREYLGVHAQKQEGLSWVGLHVPVGRLQVSDATLQQSHGLWVSLCGRGVNRSLRSSSWQSRGRAAPHPF